MSRASITNSGREGLAPMVADEFRRLKHRECRVMGLDDFTEADLSAIEVGETPPEAAAFDHERND